MLAAQRRMYVRIQAYGRESFRIHEFLGTVWFVVQQHIQSNHEIVNRVEYTNFSAPCGLYLLHTAAGSI
jgi:hypothetical protein